MIEREEADLISLGRGLSSMPTGRSAFGRDRRWLT